ncbi:MAG: hypothetical protein M1826_002814 [Phylliscum demangeonii]|nr:MAG: hypothetical protein M1826_002814 [Phylliscum demangeonii]
MAVMVVVLFVFVVVIAVGVNGTKTGLSGGNRRRSSPTGISPQDLATVVPNAVEAGFTNVLSLNGEIQRDEAPLPDSRRGDVGISTLEELQRSMEDVRRKVSRQLEPSLRFRAGNLAPSSAPNGNPFGGDL